MKAAIILILVAALGAGGWFYHQSSQQAKAKAAAEAEAALTAAQLAPGGVPVLFGGAQLPAEAKTAIDQADALWNEAGDAAATSPKAPEMARLYTKALRALYNQPGLAERSENLVKERLAPLGQTLFFTKGNFPTDRLFGVHTVTSGESPEAIAKKYGMSREFLNRLRAKDVNDSKLRIGDNLKIIKLNEQPEGEKGFALRIDKSDYILDLFIGGIFAKRYVISHGAKESPTPGGVTRVVNRVWHPDWTHPITKQVLKFGDPENILGPIWMPFDAKMLGESGIGIHGYTGADAKMQAQVSHGCIRMQNNDAEEFYHILSHPDRSPCAVEIAE
jgi:LysM repeat protein